MAQIFDDWCTWRYVSVAILTKQANESLGFRRDLQEGQVPKQKQAPPYAAIFFAYDFIFNIINFNIIIFVQAPPFVHCTALKLNCSFSSNFDAWYPRTCRHMSYSYTRRRRTPVSARRAESDVILLCGFQSNVVWLWKNASQHLTNGDHSGEKLAVSGARQWFYQPKKLDNFAWALLCFVGTFLGCIAIKIWGEHIYVPLTLQIFTLK